MDPDQPEPQRPRRSLKDRVITGAAISMGAVLSVQLLSIFNLAVLGRMLTPSDFGLVALAMMVIGFSEALINRQFAAMLIRTRANTPDEFNTAFTLSASAGLIAGLGVAAMAWPMALFVKLPDLLPVILVLALVPMLIGIRSTNFVRNEIELRLFPKAKIMVISRLTLTVVAVAIASIWPSYWALVIGTLSFHLTYTVLTFVYGRGWPQFCLKHWRGFFEFGIWLTAAGAVNFLEKRLGILIVGRMLSASDAGFFNIGREVSTTFTGHLYGPFAKALFPGLSTIQDDPERLQRSYLMVQQSVLGFALPIGIGVALVAPELVRAGMGLQWLPAVPVIQIMAPITSLMSMMVGVHVLIYIQGNTKGLFIRNCITLVIAVVGYWLLIGQYGILGAAVMANLVSLTSLYLTLRIAAKEKVSRVHEPLFVSWRSLVAVSAMSVAVLAAPLGGGLEAMSTASFSDALVILLAKVAIGGVVYIGVHYLLWVMRGRPPGFEDTLMNLFQRIFGKFLRRRALS